MKPFTQLESVVAPLPLNNVDTDQIIRVEPLFGGVPREQLGAYCFESLRGAPGYVLDQPAFHDAGILATGENFGCGSSREGAVWALMGRGVRCVVAASFGEIFRGNCYQNGVLPVVLPAEHVAALVAAAGARPGTRIRVDLERCELTLPDGEAIRFEVPRLRREALLRGLDDVALTLSREEDIRRFEQRDRERRPWIHQNIQAEP